MIGLSKEVSVSVRVERIPEENANFSSLNKEASTERFPVESNISTLSSMENTFTTHLGNTKSTATLFTDQDQEPVWRNRKTTDKDNASSNKNSNDEVLMVEERNGTLQNWRNTNSSFRNGLANRVGNPSDGKKGIRM